MATERLRRRRLGYLALLLRGAHCFSWHGKPAMTPRRWSSSLWATPDSDNKGKVDPSPAETEANGSRRRRKRSVDFPSFAYDSNPASSYRRRSEYRYTPPPSSSSSSSSSSSASRKNNLERDLGKRKAVAVWKVDYEKSFLDQLFTRNPLQGSAEIDASAKKTRLLNERAYARAEPFAAENLNLPPSLSDLSPPPTPAIDVFWITSPARILSFGLAYFSFPYITQVVNSFVDLSENQLDEIVGRFAPGISILYGTLISLTLSILYNRQRTIQDNVAVECSLLTVMTRNLLSLFRNDPGNAIEAGQCAADQIRTLVRSSRGTELMLLMYSDPYARMQELVDLLEDALYRNKDDERAAGRSASLIAFSRDVIKDLTRYRAYRLSDEALALPPTHFFILNALTILILLTYVLSVLPTVDPTTGNPSNESSLLFGALATTYILFYNFADDLNNPFRGVYQVRRSCAASHLLEAKWLIANHPLLRGEVDFEDVPEEENGVLIRCPGLGDLWFERDDIYKDGNAVEE